MIIDAIINLFVGLLEAVWSVIPEWNWVPPDGVVAHLVEEITRWDNLFPVSEIMTIISLTTTVFGAVVAFKWGKQILDWLVGLFP